MDIKDRIKQIMDHEQMTAAAFAEKIGVAPATMSHTLGDRNKFPSTDFLMKLCDSFSYVSLDWLMRGEGSLFPEENSPENEEIPSLWPDEQKNRKEIDTRQSQNANKDIVHQEIIYKEAPSKRITEIRIFFDDNTYQIFKPEK